MPVELVLTKPGEGMDATGLMAREGRSASAALTAGLSITWQQQRATVKVDHTNFKSSICITAAAMVGASAAGNANKGRRLTCN